MMFAHQPVSTNMRDGTVSHTVCTVFQNGKKKISIVLDNSCGSLHLLSRSDLRLFVDARAADPELDADVTDCVFPGTITVDATKENFEKAWEWLHNTDSTTHKSEVSI